MRARDVMTRPVRTVRPDTSIEEAAALLVEHGFAAAPVVDETGELVGMVSESDLLHQRIPPDPAASLGSSGIQVRQVRPRMVAEVMTGKVLAAYPSKDVSDIARQMVERHVRSVPVVDDGELVGIVSRPDILRTVVRTDQVIAAEAQHRLDAYTGYRHRWTADVRDGVAQLGGDFNDEVERRIATVLVRTVPGVSDVRHRQPVPGR